MFFLGAPALGVGASGGLHENVPMDPRTERQNLLKVVERLTGQFPLVSPAKVEQLVEFEYAKLDGRPVRQYVSILVEHAAKDRLAADGVTARAAAHQAA